MPTRSRASSLHLERVRGYVDLGVQEGAALVVDGRGIRDRASGDIVSATEAEAVAAVEAAGIADAKWWMATTDQLVAAHDAVVKATGKKAPPKTVQNEAEPEPREPGSDDELIAAERVAQTRTEQGHVQS